MTDTYRNVQEQMEWHAWCCHCEESHASVAEFGYACEPDCEHEFIVMLDDALKVLEARDE